MFSTWRDLYQSDLQSVYALWIVPALFLLYWVARPRERAPGVEPLRADFARYYAIFFAIETLLDPFATGLVSRWVGLGDPLATYLVILFVLLGDFRVFLLVFAVLGSRTGLPSIAVRACRWTLVVPIFAWGTTRLLEGAVGELPAQTIWIVYELGFLALAIFLELVTIDRRADGQRARYLRGLARYVALYYALWASADLLITVGGFDWGWALRVIPNQLYYAFWIPFAYFSFFTRR